MEWRNEEFDLGGVNHLALVCSDMKRTVEFYTEVLGMRLIKTLDLPNGQGQHFFFDMGGGNALAFFWFPDAPDAVPGVSAPVTVPGIGEWTSAVGSMNHVAFNVPEERFLEYRAKLKAKGVRVSPIMDHDDSEFGVARELHPGRVRPLVSTSRTRTASCSSSPAGGGSWASPATSGTSRRPRPTGPACRPRPLLSLIHVLEWRAAVHPGAIALSDQQGAELTYAGLADAVDRSAAGFAAAGVAPGHVVPVIARNQAGWVTAMLGLIRAGALPAAVNWRLAAPEVAALLRLAGPAAVLADADCAALARQAAAGLDRPVPILDLAGQQPAADGAPFAADGARRPPSPPRPNARCPACTRPSLPSSCTPAAPPAGPSWCR